MSKVLDAIVLLLYPLIVFGGLTYLGVRWTALALLVLVGRRFVAVLLKSRTTSRIVFIQAAAMVAIIGSAAASGSAFALRLAPFAVSLTFIAMFGSSLRVNSTPIIERFARLQKPNLPPDHVSYCRTLTKVWIGILAVNSALLLSASLIQDDKIWAIIVGPLSYGLIGFSFGLEYLFRKWRFQDWSDTSVIDKILRPILSRKVLP